MTGKEACYLIRKGGYFYREKWCGYTQFKFDAGRYTKEQAEAEASVEPWHMSAIHENDVPDEREPDKFIAELRATIAALEARATTAEGELSIIADNLESGAPDSDAILHIVREIEADRDIFKARAIAAEERVSRLEAALTPYVKATKYNGAGAFALNTAMLSDTDHRTAHRIIVTEPALERAALAGDKP